MADARPAALAIALTALAAVVGLVRLTTGMVRARVYPEPDVLLFGVGLMVALGVESWEQSLTGVVPLLLEVLPPMLFTATGVGLLGIALAARSRTGSRPARPWDVAGRSSAQH